jgi:uncharacterized protein with ATP-grasp and redox domains
VSNSHFEQYPPIVGQKGSFAWYTIKKRLPAILEQLIEEFQDNKNTAENLYWLKDNVAHGKINCYPVAGPDVNNWKKYLKPHIGCSWFEVPFYFAEAYFYRLILDFVGFFDNGKDPFQNQKLNDLQEHKIQMLAFLDKTKNVLPNGKEKALEELLKVNLWGNKADLSQLNMDRSDNQGNENLVNDTSEVINQLSNEAGRLDIILDNAGMELFTDLLLSMSLIQLDITERVVLHAKAYPTFVSDATSEDVNVMLNELLQTGINDFPKLFNQYRKDHRIIVQSHEFWNAPLHFYEMPPDLYTDLADSDLIFFKGDANYRRIFGDRAIPTHTSLNTMTNYLPTKSLAIRILKSEIMMGLKPEKVQSLSGHDPDWMISGKYGIIQLLN